MSNWWDYGGVQWDNGEGSHELEQLRVGNAAADASAANQGAQAAESKTDGRLSLGQPMLGQRAPSVAIEMTRQRARIAELEAENAKLRVGWCEHHHVYDLDVTRDGLQCRGCPTFVPGEALAATGYRRVPSALQLRANALADECGRLRDENTQLLAENARLRRAKK